MKFITHNTFHWLRWQLASENRLLNANEMNVSVLQMKGL